MWSNMKQFKQVTLNQNVNMSAKSTSWGIVEPRSLRERYAKIIETQSKKNKNLMMEKSGKGFKVVE